jgi:hypothetical protein
MIRSSPLPPYAVIPTVGSAQLLLVQGRSANRLCASMMSLPKNG